MARTVIGISAVAGMNTMGGWATQRGQRVLEAEPVESGMCTSRMIRRIRWAGMRQESRQTRPSTRNPSISGPLSAFAEKKSSSITYTDRLVSINEGRLEVDWLASELKRRSPIRFGLAQILPP